MARGDRRETTGTGMFLPITPHPFEATNLHEATPGQPVNLEADLLAK